MTNKEVSVQSNLHEEDETSTKNSVSAESSPVKRTNGSSDSPRKKPEGRAVVSDEETASKNNIPKKRVLRKSKKKINLDKKDPVVTKQNEQKSHKNRYKSLDDYENWHLSSTINETHVNKENLATNSNKQNVFSPNHKVTEYFQGLKLDDSLDRDAQVEQDLDKIQQTKDYQDTTKQSSILSPKQPPTGTPSKSSRRRLRQRRAKQNSTDSTNHKLTEYYQVRRSERKYKKNILDEKQRDLENKILDEVEDGLEIKDIEEKGRGVVTTKDFCKGDFVVEYIGDLIDGATAKIREAKYAKNKNIGCYMYYFKFKNTQYCIDATKESGKLGRLVNHSRKGNLISKVIEIDQTPHLVLFAKTDIPTGIELLYDYGDRSKESVKHHPWLTL